MAAAFFRSMLDKEITFRKKEKFIKNVEDATEFSIHKFARVFDIIERTLITPSHCYFLYYGTLKEIKQILSHGIPVSNRVSSEGIVFTMHKPQDIDQVDRLSFSAMEAFVVVSLPKRLLKPYAPLALRMAGTMNSNNHYGSVDYNGGGGDDNYGGAVGGGAEEDDGKGGGGGGVNQYDPAHVQDSNLWLLPNSILHAMRTSHFEDIVDPNLWRQNYLLLPPQVIKRAYLIDRNAQSRNKIQRRSRLSQVFDIPNRITSNVSHRLSSSQIFPIVGSSIDIDTVSHMAKYVQEDFPIELEKPIAISNIDTYLELMSQVRTHCAELGLIPVYHYTCMEVSSLIIKGGFKMATNGQGDGGVYFSTYGPASYDMAHRIMKKI
eukprot:CAMPEP_0114354352 /NCGR_PEP_ID=MMETSP0101-20121206/19394_1 /TAXON_ID=38822 ORGANISM="Pteridomonas danica, Strain PT" /NCGR_SAMPLE_ID=MMETSP0101 /ASSEMBLY_ACC=CAM_ASM_000211 /LENGTH=376 /DNA_ID=CAMNT_0001495735 /DNA_START=320 /DNA_END=1451 /DNA_ORIENTATION=-